jgi:hypothetical protein
MRSFIAAALVSIVAFGSLSYAADGVVEKPVGADTPEKFAIAVKQIQAEMSTGGRYEFMRPDDRGKVSADLDTMQGLLSKAGSVDAMKMEDKIRLFNTQEHVNGVLVHNDANRLVCERRAPVGTSIPQTTCRTVGELERSRLANNKYMQDALGNGDICRQQICGTAEGVSRGSKGKP